MINWLQGETGLRAVLFVLHQNPRELLAQTIKMGCRRISNFV